MWQGFCQNSKFKFLDQMRFNSGIIDEFTKAYAQIVILAFHLELFIARHLSIKKTTQSHKADAKGITDFCMNFPPTNCQHSRN